MRARAFMSHVGSSGLFLSKYSLIKKLILLIFFFLAIDMGGDFGLRNIAVPVGMLCLVLLIGLSFPRVWHLPFAMLVIYPSIAFLIGVAGGAELAIAISQLKSTVLAFIMFLVIYRIPYTITSKALLYSLFAVAFLAVCLTIGLSLGVDVVREILSTMADKGGGYFGERFISEDKIFPNVYFKATLFYVPAFVISIFLRKYWFAMVFFLALVAGISKTGMLVTGLVMLIYLFWNKNDIKLVLLGWILLGVSAYFIIQSPIFILFDEILKNKSLTVDVRVGHFQSLASLWIENPLNLLFGFGLGSTFYSDGVGGVVSNIELDHLNVIRKYGLIWALIFFSWVIMVAYYAIKNKEYEIKIIGWALLISFVVAGTNPVLISPIFFLFLFLTMAANRQSSIRNNS